MVPFRLSRRFTHADFVRTLDGAGGSRADGTPVPATTGPLPRLMEVKANADGKIMVTVMRTEMQKVQVGVGVAVPPGGGAAPPPAVVTRTIPVTKHMTVDLSEVKDLKITTADGKKIDVADAVKKLKAGGVVVVSADGKPVNPNYLKLFKDDVLVLSSPELVSPQPPVFGSRPGVRSLSLFAAEPLPLLPANPGGGIQIQIQPGVIQVAPAPCRCRRSRYPLQKRSNLRICSRPSDLHSDAASSGFSRCLRRRCFCRENVTRPGSTFTAPFRWGMLSLTTEFERLETRHMYPSLVLSAALMTPAAPLPRDTVPSTPGPAPCVLALKADNGGNVRIIGTIPTRVTITNTYFVIENNKQVQKQVEQDIVTSQYFNKTLADCNGKFTTADGKPLTVEEANGRVKKGATVLVSSDGKPIAKAWLRAVAPDTVVMVADGFSHAQPQWGGNRLPTTPAPQLAMLGTNESGKVLAPCTSHPIETTNGVYYNDMMWAGKGGFGGGRMVRSYDYGYYNPQQPNAKVVFKPLADVKFDAYDHTGKLIPRGETLKRLAAGGLVIVAGDNRMPDENYLKGFHKDVIVLVGPELVLPVTPIDKTKKKDQAKQPVKPGQVPAVQPLPALPIRPAIIRGGVQKQIVLPARRSNSPCVA